MSLALALPLEMTLRPGLTLPLGLALPPGLALPLAITLPLGLALPLAMTLALLRRSGLQSAMLANRSQEPDAIAD